MLYVCSAGGDHQRPDDLNTRARIRDAAVRRFGSDGFGTPIRAIAAEAGVSPGLVIHHFGTKEALRSACDAHVLRVIREAKTETLVKAAPGDFLAQFATVEDYAPMAGYLVQALMAGGELAGALLDQAIADAEGYLEDGVAAGRVRPSRDPAARARFLAYMGAGALLLYVRRHPGSGDVGQTLRDYTAAIALPALELYTEGLLADRSLLDAYLSPGPSPPAETS
jgi:TetR/AcrR family transcriptional regulator, regulator of cefoperazone and chloramphenicol sensitivity